MVCTARHLALVSAFALALAPAAAHARFGKASSSSDDDKPSEPSQPSNNNDSTTTHDGGGTVHAATAVDEAHLHPAAVNGGGCSSDGCCWRHGESWPAYYYEPPPTVGYVAGAGAPAVETAPAFGIRTELTAAAEALMVGNGGALAAQLRIEGLKWGVATEGRWVTVAADDGSGGTDKLSFWSGYVTYALLGNERSRLRLEAGANAAFAPDLIVVSPAVGISLAAGYGDFGLEAVARASLIPHAQVEVAAGITYALGPVGLRAGWRRMYLNDNGLVDGIAHDDVFSGPYLGAGLAF